MMKIIKQARHKNVIFNLSKFEKINNKIKEINYSSYPNEDFLMKCKTFRDKVNGISDKDEMVVESFSIIKEAIYRVLDLHP